jgi:hypothetical protein
METPSQVMARRPVIQTLETGERVEVRVETGRDEFMVIFARELAGTSRFPGWAQGSWMLTRNRNSGRGALIRVFLRSDQHTYIQFRPFTEDKCFLDVIIYGGYAVQSLPLPVPFERLYTMPVNDALALAGNKFPRRYFDPVINTYRDTRTFVSLVRRNLAGLEFADDGAIDQSGNYVFIETLLPQETSKRGLNCSGFTKWLIDGILRPITGERLAIPVLKKPFGDRGSSFTELWEERRDPYFGLDWIRNLASRASAVLRSPAYGSLEEIEVRVEPVSMVLAPENRTFVNHSYPGFLEEAGYGIEGLYPLLYTLAIDEPHRFYLAAVNNEIGQAVTANNPRGSPHLRQYFHVAALVPYFTEQGTFQIAVFESAAETSFTAFRNRYPGHYVNLVRIPIATAFDP